MTFENRTKSPCAPPFPEQVYGVYINACGQVKPGAALGGEGGFRYNRSVRKFWQNELVSGLTHLAGVPLSLVALVLLVRSALAHGGAGHVVAFSVFGASMALLYLASALYHLMPLASKAKRVMRRVDHAMIFVLIAGTYTPVCLLALDGAWRWGLLGVVWTLALAGVLAKALWVRLPGWVSALMYLGLGWLSALAWPALAAALPGGALAWLALGGAFYTVGVVFYALDKVLPPVRWFGLHEVFHLFVLAGSFSHFWLMWAYLARP